MSELESLRKSIMNRMMKRLPDKVNSTAFFKLNDPNVPTRIKRVIPTGLPSFDIMCARTPMGRCGFPIGRQVELYSNNPGAGKTSFACAMAAAAQRNLGWVTKWCETEAALDPNRAEILGLDVDNTVFSQPSCLEDAADVIDATMDEIPERSELSPELKNFGCMIVVDSVAALPSKRELEGDMDDNNIGVFQRKMSQLQRRISSKISKRNVTIIWINQTRDKIGMGPFKGGKNTYGGNALKFHCGQRWELIGLMGGKSKAKRNEAGAQKGQFIIIKNTKNKCGCQPFLETTVWLDYKNGFDYVDSWTQAMQQLLIANRVGRSVKFLEGPWTDKKLSLDSLREMHAENPQPFSDYEKIMKDYIGNYTLATAKKKKKDEE